MKKASVIKTGCIFKGVTIPVGENRTEGEGLYSCRTNDDGQVIFGLTACSANGRSLKINATETFDGFRWKCEIKNKLAIVTKFEGCMLKDKTIRYRESEVIGDAEYSCERSMDGRYIAKLLGCSVDGGSIAVNETVQYGQYEWECQININNVKLVKTGCLFGDHVIPPREFMRRGAYQWTCNDEAGVKNMLLAPHACYFNDLQILVGKSIDYRSWEIACEVNQQGNFEMKKTEIKAADCVHKDIQIPIGKRQVFGEAEYQCNIDEHGRSWVQLLGCSAGGKLSMSYNETILMGKFNWQCTIKDNNAFLIKIGCLFGNDLIAPGEYVRLGAYEWQCNGTFGDPELNLKPHACYLRKIQILAGEYHDYNRAWKIVCYVGEGGSFRMKQMKRDLKKCSFDGQTILEGDTKVIGESKYACLKDNKGAVYVKLQGCSTRGRSYDFDDTFKSGKFVWQCQAMNDSAAIVKIACLHGRTKVERNQFRRMGAYEWKCEENDGPSFLKLIEHACYVGKYTILAGESMEYHGWTITCQTSAGGGFRLTQAKTPVGCTAKGQFLKDGELVIFDNFQWECQIKRKKAHLLKINCVHENEIIEVGTATIVNNKNEYTCMKYPDGEIHLKVTGCTVDGNLITGNTVKNIGKFEWKCSITNNIANVFKTGCVYKSEAIPVGEAKAFETETTEYTCNEGINGDVKLIISGCAANGKVLQHKDFTSFEEFQWKCIINNQKARLMKTGCILNKEILKIGEKQSYKDSEYLCKEETGDLMLKLQGCFANRESLADGDSTIFHNFQWKCQIRNNAASLIKMGCYKFDKIIPIGQSEVISGANYACETNPDGSVGINVVDCYAGGKNLKAKETVVIDNFIWKCQIKNHIASMKKTGCFYKNLSIDIGKKKSLENAEYLCEEEDTGRIMLKLVGCYGGGKSFKHDETVVFDGFYWKCQIASEEASIIKIGCFHDERHLGIGEAEAFGYDEYLCAREKDGSISVKLIGCSIHGRRLEDGETKVIDNVQWTCRLENGAAVVAKTGCIKNKETIAVGESKAIENTQYACIEEDNGELALKVAGCSVDGKVLNDGETAHFKDYQWTCFLNETYAEVIRTACLSDDKVMKAGDVKRTGSYEWKCVQMNNSNRVELVEYGCIKESGRAINVNDTFTDRYFQWQCQQRDDDDPLLVKIGCMYNREIIPKDTSFRKKSYEWKCEEDANGDLKLEPYACYISKFTILAGETMHYYNYKIHCISENGMFRLDVVKA